MFSVLISHNESASLKLSERSVCDEKKKKKQFIYQKPILQQTVRRVMFFFFLRRQVQVYLYKTYDKEIETGKERENN